MPLLPARPPAIPAPTTEDLVRLTAEAQAAHLERVTLHALAEIDTMERNHNAVQHVRWSCLSLAAGFAFAVFPFTPGIIDYCKPSANPGWLCAGRSAAFLSSCEAVLVGVSMGRAIYKNRHWCDAEAVRLGVDIGRRTTGSPAWPGELIEAYRKSAPAKKEQIRSLLRRTIAIP